eukprot:10882862-Lingulodinium_polyedra.AAC.1
MSLESLRVMVRSLSRAAFASPKVFMIWHIRTSSSSHSSPSRASAEPAAALATFFLEKPSLSS